eukprot:259674-Amphidinium_carterae.1
MDKATSIACGGTFTCVILDGSELLVNGDGQVRCWGEGQYLGYGDTLDRGFGHENPGPMKAHPLYDSWD